MKLYTTVKDLQEALESGRSRGLTTGFVPTMGALHPGHLSLVSRAAGENGLTVVSIFVNPNQFNDPDDLKNYPRTLERDLELLSPLSCDCVFAPMVREIYPEPDTRRFDFGPLERVMEGRYRPGHFNGVAQVVSRLFEIVRPERAYFGRKDFQQLSVIMNMVNMLGLPVEIIACDTVRESDGLAMSSRNALLTPEHRAAAPQIYRILREAREEAALHSPAVVIDRVLQKVNATGLLRAEYFDIVDEMTLQTVSSWEEPGVKVGCIAVFAGAVRLIDNIVFDK